MEGVDFFFYLFFLLILKRINCENISMFMLFFLLLFLFFVCLFVLSIFIQRKEFFFGFDSQGVTILVRSLPVEAS